ncbi:MAG: ABC transporter permease [archaeon]
MFSVIDLIEASAKNLSRSKTRTFLTLLGIIIGVSAIVSLISIGGGLTSAVEAQVQRLGSDTIFVIPGAATFGMFKTTITTSDISNMENTSGVMDVVPIYSTSAVMEYEKEKSTISISAVESSKASIFDNVGFFELGEGRRIAANESGAVMIGDRIAHPTFEKEIVLRKQVKINGEDYKVVGILKPANTSFGGGPNSGNMVMMSYEGFKRIANDATPGIVFVKTTSKESVEGAADDIQAYFDDKYGEDSVLVSSSESILGQVNQLLGLITVFVVGIGAISMLVGGIGITNSMVTSVLERTKEIGILKAIGASNELVLSMFMLEAGFIGMVGGIIGIVIGYAFALIVSFAGNASGFALGAAINPQITFGALAFSMLVGMGAGFYPALRAARMDPVNALRYE